MANSKRTELDDLECIREISKLLESFSGEERSRIIRWTIEREGINIEVVYEVDE